jgi:hypothetical protein
MPSARASAPSAAIFFRRISGAALAHLRDADGGGLGAVHAAAIKRQRRAHRIRRQLAVRTGDGNESGAAGEEFRRGALVHHEVTVRVAEDRAIRRHERGQRQCVGGGAGDHREHRHLAREDLAEPLPHARADLVLAVRRGGAGVRLLQRCENLRRRAIGVVAEKIHAAAIAPVPCSARKPNSSRARPSRRVAVCPRPVPARHFG